MNQVATSKPRAKAPRSEGRAGVGGRRLAAAFDKVSEMPAFVEARRRLLGVTERPGASPGDVADAVEADAALAIAVMRAANNGGGSMGRTGGIREAVEELSPEGVRKIATGLETYDPLTGPGLWPERHERFRRHAVATRLAAERIGDIARLDAAEELAVGALLHDVGRLVLAELYSGFDPSDDREATPEERVRRERRELGIDHALVGAVLLRRWGIPQQISAAVERHHSPHAVGHAAAISLADQVVHYASGDAVTPESMLKIAARLDLDTDKVASLIYDFPYRLEQRRRSSEPCPLSAREIDALRGLAEGKVYKQIAQELGLSVSTIRTHLHNVYRKIGAVDRAQAVLLARERGWI
jgi:putative nucleotidyltransferase with HDIG domain